jgi:FKBP-type peptidyl-prolyl cis-trans isomerase SlyD
MSDLTVAKDRVVAINYRLTVEGSEVDSSHGRGPLNYLHGHANIVAGLERALEGRAVGDEVELDVPPDAGYGSRDEERLVQVTRDQLGFDPEVGTVVRAQLPDGREQHLMIAEVEGDQITLDGNHPLAGETLHFEVSIDSIREATPEELEKGFIE